MSTLFRLTLLLCLPSLILGGCFSDTAEESPSVRIVCGPANGQQQQAVHAIIDNQKVKIANVAVCDSIAAEAYSEYEIPAEALAAVGAWKEESGDYFYALQASEGIAFYRGYQSESTNGDQYHYQRIGLYQDGRLDLELPPRTEELVGTYALNLEQGSHILFVGLKEDTVVAEYFRLEGMLPPPNQLNMLMTGLTPEDTGILSLNPQTLRFDSDLGSGRFQRAGSGLSVRLQRDGQESVVLEKILSKDYSIPVQ